MAELLLRNVRKTYVAAGGTRRLVLAGIDLTVQTGEFVVLVGPSGCGKTTLLRIIAGLTEPDPDDFTLTIDAEPITRPGPDRGVVFQQYHSYPWLSVLDNVKFGLQFLDIPESKRVERAEEQLQLVGLSDYRDEYPNVLSGGQQQRVAIARTLATGPRVILMDEPFAALDAQTREAMQAELLQLQARTKSTIVFVTHDIAEAAFLGNHVYVLSRMPATIIAHVDTRTSREKILGTLGVDTLRDRQDGRLDAKRGEWLRYDFGFVEIQRTLKQALESQAEAQPEEGAEATKRIGAGIVEKESLADRDAELARAMLAIIENPDSLKDKSGSEVAWLVRYCLARLRLLRMGGRSAPLVALSVIVWVVPEKCRLDVEETLSLALAISTDPSYIWPEWALVLAGVVLARFDSLASVDDHLSGKGRRELLAQAELRLVHLHKQIPPSATSNVSRVAATLLAELREGFPRGIQPVVQAASEGWPKSDLVLNVSNDDIEKRVGELDRSMPAWYSEEERAIYRLSMERRNTWLIDSVSLE